jgi:uncharacterized protein YihD (DUF1040 family)
MRDPKRIPIILDAIRVEWEKNPDLRLLQLLVNTMDSHQNPLFHVEDDLLLKRLVKNQLCPNCSCVIDPAAIKYEGIYSECDGCGVELYRSGSSIKMRYHDE